MSSRIQFKPTSCCGMKELADISCGTPKEAIGTMCYQLRKGYSSSYPGTYPIDQTETGSLGNSSFSPPLVIFTTVVGKRNRLDHTARPGDGYVKSTTCGKDLSDYIASHGLGKVVDGPVVVNPITNNQLQLFTYLPDYEALKAWWKNNWNTFRIVDGPDPGACPSPVLYPDTVVEVRELKDGETAGVFPPTPSISATAIEAQVNAAPTPAMNIGEPAPEVAMNNFPSWIPSGASAIPSSSVAPEAAILERMWLEELERQRRAEEYFAEEFGGDRSWF